MRKIIFIFIALLLLAANIDYLHSCCDNRTEKDMFSNKLTYAYMYEYVDKEYGFAIRYPYFFDKVPDSLRGSDGHARFTYGDQWVNIVIEGYALYKGELTMKQAKDSLAELLHSTNVNTGKNFFTLSGPQYEQGSLIKGYSYYSKFMLNGKFLFVYTMIYPDGYKDVLTRLFKEIDDWQIWERPRLEVKQV